MPADATNLTCGYFFNDNTSNSNSNSNSNANSKGARATINENQLASSVTSSSTHETGNTSHSSTTLTATSNKGHKVRISMEVYKAKPQYLSTYKASVPSVPAAASAASTSAKWAATADQADLHHWSKIKKMGAGLYNLGNNCYLNATLQCMAYTPSLSQWLVSRPHSPVCKVRPLKGFCTLCEVEKIIYDIFNSCNEYAKPNSLCFNIKKVSNVFGVGTQEDASEFFTTLLESMTKAIKFPPNAASSPSPSPSAQKASNILDDIFSFQFRSRITCGTCGRLSDTFENTNSWPVDVKYITDIRKGMVHFLREELLDGENSYRCDACQRKVRATKKYSMQTAPNVLVVNLKRFDFTYAGKLSHFVTYPETLSLKTFVGDSGGPLSDVAYRLYGVLVHLGHTSHSGHYYSYVRGPSDVWYKADDTQVSTVRVQDALDQNAYILFYNRIGQPNSSTATATATATASSAPFLAPAVPVVEYNPTPLSTRPATATASSCPAQSKHIPEVGPSSGLENKFKSTFVPADREQSKADSDQQKAGSSSSKTLNYDQVLKIKKMNKRKLKLVTSKQKLKELKRQRKSVDCDGARRKLKKRIKRLKKTLKRQKAKIKKLRKYESCSESESETECEDSSSAETDWAEASSSHKRKLSAEPREPPLLPQTKKPKTCSASTATTSAVAGNKNSLSLLQQYSSSSASSSDDESEASSRSSRSSSISSSASNKSAEQPTSQNDAQANQSSPSAASNNKLSLEGDKATSSLYSSQSSSSEKAKSSHESRPLENSASASAGEAHGPTTSAEANGRSRKSEEEAFAPSYNKRSPEVLDNKSSYYKSSYPTDYSSTNNNNNSSRSYHYNNKHANKSKHHHYWKGYSSYDSGHGYKHNSYNKGFNHNYNRYRLNNNSGGYNNNRPKSGSTYSRY